MQYSVSIQQARAMMQNSHPWKVVGTAVTVTVVAFIPTQSSGVRLNNLQLEISYNNMLINERQEIE